MAKLKKRSAKRGMFILIEGISGSGKTTLARDFLVPYLKEHRIRAIFDSEPTQNAIGKGIRKLIEGTSFSYDELQEFSESLCFVAKSAMGLEYNSSLEMQLFVGNFQRVLYGVPDKVRSKKKLDELEYQMLYIADRFLDVELTIIPALEMGIWVVLDRYDLSTYAYGMSRGLGMLGLSDYHFAALGRHYLKPDAVIFVDVPATIAVSRLKKSGKPIDRFEKLKSLKAVAKAYKDVLTLHAFTGYYPIPAIHVNGNQSKQKVLDSVLWALSGAPVLPRLRK